MDDNSYVPAGEGQEKVLNPFAGAALDSIAQRQFAKDIDQIERQQRLTEPVRSYKKRMSDFNIELGKQKLAWMKEFNLKKKQMQEDMLRSQAIGSIMGFGGMAAGAMLGGMAGGPTGAMMGAQVGGQAGSGIGQTMSNRGG